MNFGEIKNIHFVGIGGIGMSGLAEILSDMGASVSGCDLRRSSTTDLLTSRGIPVAIGHSPDHLAGVELVVITAAVRSRNPEIDAAREQGIAVMKRSEVLGEIVNSRRAVGISGTHGKTTTSAMVTMVLLEAGLDPTVIVGGVLRNLSANAKSGRGEFVVVEADEYDRTFHQLRPEIAVVTNIEADHLEYYGSFEAIEEAFRIFLGGIRPDGVIVACADDPVVLRVVEGVKDRRVVLYGLSEKAQLRATRLRFDEQGSTFDIRGLRSFAVFVPGEHNIRNALAAIAVAQELKIEPEVTARGLARFLGVTRRFQILGKLGGALIVDDYAHHPTEIRATLEAARKQYPKRRLLALFQPHLYSRTRDFARAFGESLLVADVGMVAPIYAAREEPIAGITGRLIVDSVEGLEYLDHPNTLLVEEIRRRLRPDDVFITMGAGDVHEIAEALVAGGTA